MEKVDLLIDPLREFLVQAVHFLKSAALVIAIVVAGWLIAKVVRFAVQRGLRAINFNVVTERSGLDGFLRQGGIQSDTTAILAMLMYWLVILAAFAIAFDRVGLTYITDLLGRVVWFVPRIALALLILALGAYFARFVGGTVLSYCRTVGMKDADMLGKLAQYALMVFVVLIALDELNVGGDIVRESFLIILGGVVLALALAFGLGGQQRALELIDRWWPPQRTEEIRKRHVI